MAVFLPYMLVDSYLKLWFKMYYWFPAKKGTLLCQPLLPQNVYVAEKDISIILGQFK